MKKLLFFLLSSSLILVLAFSSSGKANTRAVDIPEGYKPESIRVVTTGEQAHIIFDTDLINEIIEQIGYAELTVLDSVANALIHGSGESIRLELNYDNGRMDYLAFVTQTGGEWYIQRPWPINKIYRTNAEFVDLLSKPW